MKRATIIVFTGIVLLFLGGLFMGLKVFSPDERSLQFNSHISETEQVSPEVAKGIQRSNNIRRIRLALSSFDLVGGFTSRELENIPSYNLTFPFFLLLACFWLILGLRKPKRD